MKNKIAFFDTKTYDKNFFDSMNKKYKFRISYFNNRLNRDTAGLTAGFDTVCAFVNDTLDKKTVDILKKNGIRLIAMRCAGYNNVDLKAVYGSIHVVRVPAYSPYAVAEHAAALILTLNRKTHKAYARVRDGNFSINGLLGMDLHGKTAGVVGTGRIGRCLIAILKGFGMKILAFDLRPDKKFAKEANIKYGSLDELYRNCDVISLNCPLTPKTYHMINAKSISRMKKGIMIINTGRGKLVDTKALIGGLKKGKIGAAGLDVYEEEGDYFFEDLSDQMIADDVLARLMTFPNVLITSHQAFFTREAMEGIAGTTLNNINEFYRTGYAENEICYRCDHPCRRKNQKLRRSCF